MERQKAFAFVSGGQSGKPGTADRKLIRSHCMLGKNKRQVVKSPEIQLLPCNGASSPSSKALLLSFPISHICEKRLMPTARRFQSKGKQCVLELRCLECGKTVDKIVLSPVAISTPIQFADEVDSRSLKVYFNAAPIAMRIFSLRHFGLPPDMKSSQWRDWLFLDAIYVNGIIMFTSAIQDFLLQQEPSTVTSVHLRKTITQLNKRLSDADLSLTDSTVALIVGLCVASFITNNYNALRAHTAGLRKIVSLRGGLDSFYHNPTLLVAMARVDLCISLGLGQSPILTNPSPPPFNSNSVRIGSYYKQPAYSYTEQCVDGLVDSRLAAIFRNLQYLARRTNGSISGQGVMQESELHAGIWTAQYQLFQLEGVIDDILGECLRVAMLVFLTTTFQVLGSRIKYEHITKRFRVLCRAIGASTQHLQELMFWMLMVGAIALFDHDEPWLCQRWRSLVLPGQDWIDVQRRLRSFIWINVCNEGIGKHTFEKMRQNSRKTLGL